jgi:CDP-4-dehydro-6-deoxyglucose reductase/3-phenylpropionate/trans-cinnamate dioxygenase ferredoxin reductase subunit
MIEHQIRRRTTRPMHLFWGGRTEQDLYMSSLPESWAKRYPWFSFTPVLSAAASTWTGATGHVQDVAITVYPDLSNAQVFACGSLAMVNSAKLSLCSHARLLERDFYSDAFVSSGLDEGAV